MQKEVEHIGDFTVENRQDLATMSLYLAGPMAQIVFNRPEIHNAANVQWVEDFAQLTKKVEANKNIRVLILTGSGPSFCSGIDVKALSKEEIIDRTKAAEGTLTLKDMDWFSKWETNLRRLETMDKFTIACLHGASLGGGLQIALACSYIIAIDDEDNKIGLTAFEEGIITGLGRARLRKRNVAATDVQELVYKAKRINAREAESMKIINEVVPLKEFENRLREIALMAHNSSHNALSGVRRQEIMRDEEFQQELEEYLTYQLSALNNPDFSQRMTAYQNMHTARTLYAQQQT